MAYEVTATRRRPQKFEDLIGQDFVVATLQNAIKSNRIAHAYLFSGPRGCGKTSSARILAKSLNCEHGPTATPCGVCSSCQEITKGASLDVIEIDGASNTSVNDIRQIKDEILFPPNTSRYKIYIIDEVHMLSTSAFNALLKTIEEPPEYIIFIFATTEIHKVPATIKSRCQQFNFRLANIESIQKLLQDSCREMNIVAESEALLWIAKEATGSYRDAYTLFDQVAAFSGNEITYEKIKAKLGLVGIESINELAEACIQGKTGEVLNFASALLEQGVSIEQFITDLSDYFRSLLFIASGITKESILGHPVERFSELARKSWSPIQLERGLSLLLSLFRDLRYSLNPRYELDIALSRLAWLSRYVSPAEVKTAIDQARSLLTGGSVMPPTSQYGGDQSHPFYKSSLSENQVQRTFTTNDFEKPDSTYDSNNKTNDFSSSTSDNFSVDVLEGEEVASSIFSSLKQRLSDTVHEEINTAHLASQTQQANFSNSEIAASNSEQKIQQMAEPTNSTTLDNVTEIADKKEAEPDISIDQIKHVLFDVLGEENQFLLPILQQCTKWDVEANTIFITAPDPFTESRIFKEHTYIEEIINNKIGKVVKIATRLKKEEMQLSQESLPESVEILKAVFKGEVKITS